MILYDLGNILRDYIVDRVMDDGRYETLDVHDIQLQSYGERIGVTLTGHAREGSELINLTHGDSFSLAEFFQAALDTTFP